jgi:hypothetical protein
MKDTLIYSPERITHQVGSSAKVASLYSRGTKFESQSEHSLSELRRVMVFLSHSSKI